MSASGEKKRVDNAAWRDLWGTPAYVIDWIARFASGPLGLDVCASAENAKAPLWFEGPCVKATPLLDGPCQCGLCSEWPRELGFFMNPPSSQNGPFADKLIQENALGSVGWALVPSATGTHWFRRLTDAAAIVLFSEKRIQFIEPEEAKLARLAEGLDPDAKSTSTFDNCLMAFVRPEERKPTRWGYIDWDWQRPE